MNNFKIKKHVRIQNPFFCPISRNKNIFSHKERCVKKLDTNVKIEAKRKVNYDKSSSSLAAVLSPVKDG